MSLPEALALPSCDMLPPSSSRLLTDSPVSKRPTDMLSKAKRQHTSRVKSLCRGNCCRGPPVGFAKRTLQHRLGEVLNVLRTVLHMQQYGNWGSGSNMRPNESQDSDDRLGLNFSPVHASCSASCTYSRRERKRFSSSGPLCGQWMFLPIATTAIALATIRSCRAALILERGVEVLISKAAHTAPSPCQAAPELHPGPPPARL